MRLSAVEGTTNSSNQGRNIVRPQRDLGRESRVDTDQQTQDRPRRQQTRDNHHHAALVVGGDDKGARPACCGHDVGRCLPIGVRFMRKISRGENVMCESCPAGEEANKKDVLRYLSHMCRRASEMWDRRRGALPSCASMAVVRPGLLKPVGAKVWSGRECAWRVPGFASSACCPGRDANLHSGWHGKPSIRSPHPRIAPRRHWKCSSLFCVVQLHDASHGSLHLHLTSIDSALTCVPPSAGLQACMASATWQ